MHVMVVEMDIRTIFDTFPKKVLEIPPGLALWVLQHCVCRMGCVPLGGGGRGKMGRGVGREEGKKGEGKGGREREGRWKEERRRRGEERGREREERTERKERQNRRERREEIR